MEKNINKIMKLGLSLPEFKPNNIEVNKAIEVTNQGDKCPECGKLVK